MTIEKLKSGSYRARVSVKNPLTNSYTKKSFTAPTKKEAIFLAQQFENTQSIDYVPTLREACNQFMEFKKNNSPTTKKSRGTFIRTRFQNLMDVKLNKITIEMIQKQLDFEKTNIIRGRNETLSTKYMTDMLSFFLMVICKYNKQCNFSASDFVIEKDPPKEYHLPSVQEMEKIYELVQGTEYEIGILLACRMSLRTSEIRGLKWKDVHDGIIYVHQAKVLKNYLKETKTKTSTRYIPIPEDIQHVFNECPRKSDFVFPHGQNYLWRHLTVLLEKNGFQHYTVHSLRHFFSSYALYMGCDQRIIERIGGWTPGSKVLSNTYQKVFIDKMKDELKKMM